ncbi:restriction endonuclease subunit S [Aurantiacibacter odishensis]|uniref:restriction endonuclease subunit S n=1 Tax=Aurantiacibacter odishensis TaxID=1155476 RepID=UPI000E72212A|nr:restriction endonuclease subunit S [Aurantiacibacter odishensis]
MSSLPADWQLPEGWTMKAAGDVATLQRGFDLPVQDRQDGVVPIFAANGSVGTHSVHKVEGPGVVTGRSGSLGNVHFVEENFWPLNTALWVKDFHGNEPKWVSRLLRWMRLEQYTRGVGVPTLNRNLVHEIEIPVPPLDEQKRIAAILDQADELRRKRQRAIDRLNQFGEAAFAQLDISKGRWSELSEVCEFENGDRGKNYPGKKSLLSKGIPFVSAADLDANGEVVRSNLSYISDARFEMLRSGKFAGGDFLFCLRGSLGKFALVPDGMSGAIASSLIIIRISDSLDHEFFRGYLGSRLVKKEIDFYSNGLAQPNLSGASLKKFKIFLPPIEVQKKFGATMSKIGETRERLLRSKAQLDHLFASLQHSAFLGGL